MNDFWLEIGIIGNKIGYFIYIYTYYLLYCDPCLYLIYFYICAHKYFQLCQTVLKGCKQLREKKDYSYISELLVSIVQSYNEGLQAEWPVYKPRTEPSNIAKTIAPILQPPTAEVAQSQKSKNKKVKHIKSKINLH